MEYARVPHELWADRLLRLKRAGFNCVEIYTFWNWHEPKEGVFNFSGDHDLDAFLKLVKKMGMYVIARVGPYYCAEWDFGGYPLWLRFKPGFRVREPNAAFEKYTGRFFDRLIPIVAANQINHGGSVILVQLENEHNLGWGTVMPNDYFRFLKEKALSLGLEVPYFFSGLHHGSDPAEDRANLDDPTRPNPWMSTEFWCVWYNGYGSTEKDAKTYEYRTWKIISRGGNGYNYYMAHGGSNFGYTNNDEDAASYDYGAAVGQGGDLRPVYYTMKRAALFARSFQDILENSTGAPGGYRVSPAGKIRFVDTLSGVLPFIEDAQLSPGVRLDRSASRILTVQRQGREVTVVAYGEPGSRVRLSFTTPSGPFYVDTTVRAEGKPLVCAAKGVRVLVMSQDWADRTWVIGSDIVCGPRYAGNWTPAGLETEGTDGPVWVFTEGAVRELKPVGVPAGPSIATLRRWEDARADQPAATSFDDAQWLSGAQPLQMGADGDSTADAWYRTAVRIDKPGKYTLLVQGADRASAFVDGKIIDSFSIKAGAIPFTFTQGSHQLAIFTAHDGRDKLAGYLGPVDKADRKGLFGKALLIRGVPPIQVVEGWQMVKASAVTDVRKGPPSTGWQPYTIGQDAFDHREGYGWFQATLPDPTAPMVMIHFASVDENATVFINGKRMVHHDGWNEPFDVTIEHADTLARPIKLTVFVENYSNEGGIDKPVQSGALDDPMPVTGWRMHGGPGRPGPKWMSHTYGAPCWWKNTFTLNANPTEVWRVIPKGLGHGSIWVNGHNLGRYPEKIPVDGLYIPNCWLKKGDNMLLVFEEDGRDASQVSVEMEKAASRSSVIYH
jgi:beta-galactosidase